MPAIGYYPLSGSLHEALFESNLEILPSWEYLRYQVLRGFEDIRDYLREDGVAHIARSMYRDLVDQLEEVISLDLPSWEALTDESLWEDYLEEWYSHMEPEWEIAAENPWRALDYAAATEVGEGDAHGIAEHLVKTERTVLVLCYSNNGLYVIKSPFVSNCRAIKESPYHPFEGLADPSEAGGVVAYVLDPQLVQLALDAEEEEERRWQKRQQESSARSTR